MPEQMFLWVCGKRNFLIGASTQRESQEMLSKFLEERPALPAFINWDLAEICGKLEYGIFSITILS